MIEKTPSIDDVQPGGPTRAEWGNAIRDAAAAHYPGGNFVGSSRGGYHRPPLPTTAGSGIIGFCCGAFSAGHSVSATVTWVTDGAGVAVGDTIVVSDPCREYYNTSGSACGAAVKTIDQVGTGTLQAWYMIRLTCYNFLASCGETGTGSNTGSGS